MRPVPRLCLSMGAGVLLAVCPVNGDNAGARAQETVLAGPVSLPQSVTEYTAPEGAHATWVGLSHAGIPVVFLIERAGPQGSVSVLWAEAGQVWVRGTGVLTDQSVHVRIGDDDWIGTWDEADTLHMSRDDGWLGAVLSPAALADITEPSWHDAFHGAQEIVLDGPVASDGRPTPLVALLYTPPGDGPFPLAVLHHGATNSGTNAAEIDRIWTNRYLAAALSQRGYAVAVPHRQGRGGSAGLYAEGLSALAGMGYSCDRGRAIDGYEHALADIDAIMDSLHARTDISDEPALVIGHSRGGALALGWASAHPGKVRAVINISGGWVEETCEEAYAINRYATVPGVPFAGPSLWLYGSDDPVFSDDHTSALFAAHRRAGGGGDYVLAPIPWAGGGHDLITMPRLYAEPFNSFLDGL